MKPPFSFVGRDRCSRRNVGDFALLLLFVSISFARLLYAQVGDNNVAGPSGIFNGQAGGCGYDPYTGNATRSITDIAVARAVGEYPLALVRTANSRTPSMTGYSAGTAVGTTITIGPWRIRRSPTRRIFLL
jgi:hypothetical protein